MILSKILKEMNCGKDLVPIMSGYRVTNEPEETEIPMMNHAKRTIETKDQALRAHVWRAAQAMGKTRDRQNWRTDQAWILHVVTQIRSPLPVTLTEAIVRSALKI